MEATGEHVTGQWIYWAELRAGLLGAALALVSPIVQAEGLTHAFAHAMEQDPTWAEARARYAEVLADRDLARAGYHPVLTVAGRATANHREVVGDYFGLQDIDRSDDFEAFGYSIQLRQPILRLDRWRQRDAASLRVAAAAARLNAAEVDLMLRVADAYFAALDAEQDLEFAKAELRAISDRADQVREQAQLEIATELGRSEADAQRELARARVLRAEQALLTRRAELALITGEPTMVLSAIRSYGYLPELSTTDREAWVQQARESNPLLVATRLESEVASRAVDIERAARLPTLDLIAQRDYIDNSGGVSGEREDSEDLIGLELRLPVFDGGATRARTTAAVARYEQALARQARAQRQAEFQATSAHSALLLGREQVAALRTARSATYDAVEATEGGVFAGTRTEVDLVQALRERFDAERALTRAVHGYLLNSLRLKAAAGTLGTPDLMSVNRMLDD